jgi:hypothetical protein
MVVMRMNVDADLVPELQRRNLVAKMPAGHISQRQATNYRRSIRLSKSERTIQIPDVDLSQHDPMGAGGRVEEDGTDALAWYSSFHCHPKGQWGIFVLDGGIYYLADKVFEPMLKHPSDRGILRQTTLINNSQSVSLSSKFSSLNYSFRLLFFHEYFHFLTDVAASVLEIGTKSVPRPLYLDYMKQVYMKSRSKSEPLEEALANAFAFDRVTSHRSLAMSARQSSGSHLWVFMKKQPNGYCAFDSYIRPFFIDGVRDLGMCIANGKAGVKGCVPLEVLFATSKGWVYTWDVPVYVVSTGISSKRLVDIPIPV